PIMPKAIPAKKGAVEGTSSTNYGAGRRTGSVRLVSWLGLMGDVTAVDRQRHAGHEGGLVRAHPHHGFADILGGAETAQWMGLFVGLLQARVAVQSAAHHRRHRR